MAANHHPVGGKDYPRTLQEFDEFFSSEAACSDFLRRLRWPDGFQCPACNEHTASELLIWAENRVATFQLAEAPSRV
jgi:hypothetical protein